MTEPHDTASRSENSTSHQPDEQVTVPDVSVVVPTCNRSEVLGRCLVALDGQSHTNFEIIIVDDASTDDTSAVIESFVNAHPHRKVTAIRQHTHAGANPCRMLGARYATAPLIAFLDCDCIAEPRWLVELARAFEDEHVAAATGLVQDPPPANIYDVTFRGTHRIARAGRAHRLIAGNMCFRRAVLERFPLDTDRARPLQHPDGTPDVSVSGRGDEEGVFLRLQAAGCHVAAQPSAAVLHDDHMHGRRFWRQAFRGGRSAARLVYKFRLLPRLDMLPFMLGYGLLPLALIDWRQSVIPVLFLLAGLAAITWNDLTRKGKTLGETMRSFPWLGAYYHVRLWAYVTEALRLRLTRHDLERMPRSWRSSS